MNEENKPLGHPGTTPSPSAAQDGATVVGHTPGPWAVDRSASERGMPCVRASDETIVADYTAWSTDDLTEALANARLMAAALDMFVALDSVAEWLDWYFAEEPLVRAGPTMEELRGKVLAAIAKAEGRS